MKIFFAVFLGYIIQPLIVSATGACDPQPAGLVGWWRGEGNANDSIGTNNGTLSASGASFAPGMVGQAFRFDGTNGYVQIPDSSVLEPNYITVEAWVWLDPNLPSDNGSEQIVFKKNTWDDWFEGYSLLKDTVNNGDGTTTDEFEFVISSSGDQVTAYSTTVAQRGVWYHVAGTYDGNQIVLYVNGVAEASATAGFQLDYDTTPVYIGTTGTWAPYLNMFGGMIDEVSIYNQALPPDQIAAIYDAGSAGKCPPPPPATNSWIGSASANWEDADWSLGELPGTNQIICLTNAGWKAVEIGENTSENYPQSLAIDSLTISSPTNSFNELLMNYAGLETPLFIDTADTAGSLVVESNSAFVMLHSSLIVRNGYAVGISEAGAFSVGGTFVESAGSQVTSTYLDLGNIGAASFDLTNSTLQVYDNETIGGFGFPTIFIQDGGSNLPGNLVLEEGSEYDFYGGYVYPAFFEGGTFNQWGGNIGGLQAPWQGEYHLAGGTFTAAALSLPSGGYDTEGEFDFLQTGGTNNAGTITLGIAGGGTYTLAGGTLVASSLNVDAFSSPIDPYSNFGMTFDQSGGYHTNGGVSLIGAGNYYYGYAFSSYRLSGGLLATPSISLETAQFVQSGGTNEAGTITVDENSSYQLTGGELLAGTIDLQETAFVHSGGAVVSPVVVIFGNGTWQEQTNGAQLGQLQLEGGMYSAISFSSNPAVLRFGDSSSASWATNALLAIQNWNGSLYGGGRHQLIFGGSQTALTARQLAEVQFQNPAGLVSGTYSARILADGEVVPDSGSPLPLNLESAGPLSNGAFSMILQGNVGQVYEIDVSTDLVDWVMLSTQSNSTGTVTFSDTGASNSPQRFYRARASD